MTQISPYVQDADPGAVGGGAMWVAPTSGDVKFRNSADSGWTTVGNINTDGLGLLSRGGGTMTGSIEGAHGLAPLDSPPLINTPTVDAEEIATKAWVTEELGAYQLKG